MPQKKVPHSVMKSLGIGVLLMALFTVMWLGVACLALSGQSLWICLGTMIVIGFYFVLYGAFILKKAGDFPLLTDLRAKRKALYIKKWYSITFGLEGVLIAVACILLYSVNQSEYIITAIAFIVGAHFLPLAKLFNRQLDYYTGVWTMMIALFTFILLKNDLIDKQQSFLLLGIGVAVATIAYGIFMIWMAQEYFKKARS